MNPNQGGGGSPSHHLRFYIVMVTLVVGGIMFLLLFNQTNPNGFSLTSAIIGETNKTADSLFQEDDSTADVTKKKINQVFGEEVKKNGKEVPVSITFDQIPHVKKDTKVSDLELQFNDLTTTISINDDKLELNNIKEVRLRIKSFVGVIDFDEDSFGMNGVARRIEINDVAFSYEDDLSISFSNLLYNTFTVDDISLKEVEFPQGNGMLSVAEKLSYTLEGEEVKVYSYDGAVRVSKETNTTAAVTMDGTMQGISVSGQALAINVW